MAPHQAYYRTPGHVVAAGIVLPIIDITMLILRVLARKKRKQAFGADDWLMLPGTLLTLAIGIAMIYGVSQQALGYPLVNEDFHGDPFAVINQRVVTSAKVQFAYILLLPFSLGCIKLSIIYFYMRIFTVTATSTTYMLLLGLAVLVVAWAIGFFFANLFQCNLDIWAMWGSTEDLRSHCPNTMFYDLALCITDFITDVIIICVPVVPVWRLHISIAEKIAASCVLLLGTVTVVASLLRLIMTSSMVTVGFDPNEDAMLVVTEFLYWGMVECGVAIFAGCLPIVQALFRGHSWKLTVRSMNPYKSHGPGQEMPEVVHPRYLTQHWQKDDFGPMRV